MKVIEKYAGKISVGHTREQKQRKSMPKKQVSGILENKTSVKVCRKN